MNYLKGKRVYLSGPIEHGNEIDWRTEPKKILSKELKMKVFDPFADPKQQWAPLLKVAREQKDYAEMQRIARRFVKKDLGLVDRSDLVCAYLPYQVATTGTHHEIINGSDRKKPTLIVCPQGREKIPLWYFGFVPLEFMFGSFDEMFNYLREVNNGLHKDNDRWWFVYELI